MSTGARTCRRWASAAASGRRRWVRVLAGSDAVATIAAEIALLVDCGLTIEQALAAGSAARGFLGVEPEGDLVSFDADPRSDPEVLASPAAVVIRGVRVV